MIWYVISFFFFPSPPPPPPPQGQLLTNEQYAERLANQALDLGLQVAIKSVSEFKYTVGAKID